MEAGELNLFSWTRNMKDIMKYVNLEQSKRLTMPEVHFVSVLLISYFTYVWRV